MSVLADMALDQADREEPLYDEITLNPDEEVTASVTPAAPSLTGDADGTVTAEDREEDRKRAEHEAAEAKRKAEWEAEQQAKKEARQKQLERLASLSDNEVVEAAMSQVNAAMERLTRRNMKECVAEYIQTLCLSEPAFARLTIHPQKSLVNCFHYINRKARDFLEQEMNENNNAPENGVFGGDVPDDLCYQWAEEYFRDLDAPEDQEKKKTFTPTPYYSKKSSPPKAAKRKAAPQSKSEDSQPDNSGQSTFMEQATLFDFDKPAAELAG